MDGSMEFSDLSKGYKIFPSWIKIVSKPKPNPADEHIRGKRNKVNKRRNRNKNKKTHR